MAFRVTEIGLMVQGNPAQARKRLLTLFRQHGGNCTRVSENLDVNVATIKRWIAKLGIRTQIDKMREAAA